jgi:hypothetical protein
MGAAASSGRVMSRDEVDAELSRLQAEEDEISAALLELADHPGYRLLNGGTMAGVTAEKWDTAKALIATLWDGLAAHKQVVQGAAGLRSRRQHPGQAELAELTRLLTGPSAELDGPERPIEQRGLLEGPRKAEKLTLAALTKRMSSGFRDATQIVATAESAWSEQVSRLSRAEAAWHAADQLVRSLGLQPGRDATASTVARLGDELTEVRKVVLSDPMAACRNGRLTTEPIDRTQREIDAVASDLQQAARIRAEFDERADQIKSVIDALDTAEADLRVARETLRQKIAAASVQDVPVLAPGLRSRLAALPELRRQGSWSGLAAAAAELQSAATAALAQAQSALAEVSAPLMERNELRGRLKAYQAKAAGTGHGEDLDLAASYRQAQDLLWTAPCELEQARAAVLAYQAAVASRSAQPGARPAARSEISAAYGVAEGAQDR